jgi:hypothetical protein
LPQWPIARKTLEVEFIGEVESIFETALDHESEDQLSTFGEITIGKKSHATVPLMKNLAD